MKVSNITRGLCLSNNRVKPGALHLVFSHYWQRWARVLYDFNGTYVEVDLTPINPKVKLNWEKVTNANIRRHMTARDPQDLKYANVQPGTLVYVQVTGIMLEHMPLEKIAELLHREYLTEIDWDRFSKYNNGGVFFKDCMKQWSP